MRDNAPLEVAVSMLDPSVVQLGYGLQRKRTDFLIVVAVKVGDVLAY